MKIFRPVRYHETFRLTFSKKVDGHTEKRAFTVVETTRKEMDALIRAVFAENLEHQNEKRFDFVKLTVQIIRFETGKPRGKDEWSYRLYRATVGDIDRLTAAVMDSQVNNPDELTHSVIKIGDQEYSLNDDLAKVAYEYSLYPVAPSKFVLAEQGFKDGAYFRERQLMKNAVDAFIYKGGIRLKEWPLPEKYGKHLESIKLIIIKED